MTIFKMIKSKNIDELAEWIDEVGIFDDSPCLEWWDKNFCQKCESITMPRKEYGRIDGWKNYSDYYGDIECAYCEVNSKCRYFEDMDEIPNSKEIIKMWLESEI